ncbi:MAG TPA: type II toxin-antitoxin system VapC family toxin [Kofleriaceae bacterium]|nr:type II toxin-antitoxin system VapC family toxin [Kofleriaceae bacterium]
MSFLVDTNVLSELARPSPDARVVRWASALDELAISVITLDELLFGITAKPNVRVQRWFDTFVEENCRVLEVTPAVARHAGILRGQLARRGKSRTQADMLLAATATAHGLTLATRNERDFEGCGIALVNPFTLSA